MHISRRGIAILALAALFSGTAPVGAQPGSSAAGAVGAQAASGATVRCITSRHIERTRRSEDENAILFLMRGPRDYVNQLQTRCTGLGTRAISYRTRAGQLCSGDSVRLAGRATTCRLGEFHEVPHGAPF